MHDGPQPGECEPGTGPDEQLLPDPDIDHPVRVLALGPGEGIRADLGEDDGDARILVEQARDDGGEAITHGVHDRETSDRSGGGAMANCRTGGRRAGPGGAAGAQATLGSPADPFGSTRATTTRGCPGCGAVNAAYSAS